MSSEEMNDLLTKIALTLAGVCSEDLTYQEREIATLLIRAGFLCLKDGAFGDSMVLAMVD